MIITREIFQVGGDSFTSPEDAAVYLINFGGQAAVVDAGCGHTVARLMDNIRACGVSREQIQYLLLTHCHYDHGGGAKTFRDSVRCEIVAHELDARYLEEGDNLVTAAQWYGRKIQPVAIDRKLTGPKEELKLGSRVITAFHTPGHSPGSVVYMVESEGLKVLFAQDVHGPLHPSILSNEDDYLRSLGLLLSLEADILCEGHFGIYEGKEEVHSYIRSFLR